MIKKLLFLATILSLVASLIIYQDWKKFWETSEVTIGQDFEIFSGESGSSVIKRLAQSGIIIKPLYVKLWLRYLSEDKQFKTGFYSLKANESLLHVLDKFLKGKVASYQITIIPGWTYSQALTHIMSNSLIVNDVEPSKLLHLLNIENSTEGWFFPDTYQFTRHSKASELLKRGHKALVDNLEEAWSKHTAYDLLTTPYELLIMASIVEKETSLIAEKPRIAGVFLQRLATGMRLQTDPTVIYGLGKSFDGNLKRIDLRTDTPYNTYTRFGLPPTPIALPDLSSLMAVAQPDMTGDLYFVADGSGGHVFAATLEEHNANVRKYQLNNRKRSKNNG